MCYVHVCGVNLAIQVSAFVVLMEIVVVIGVGVYMMG